MDKYIALKNGTEIPQIGFGTDNFKSQKELSSAIETAYKIGYKLIDVATGYEHSHLALRSFLSKFNHRENLFICSKFHNGDIIKYKSVKKIIHAICDELDIKYIDMVLLHNPSINNFPEVFDELISLKKKNIVKSIGVSNFTIEHLSEQLGKERLKYVDVNQIEIHPYLTQPELIRFCKEHNIYVMAHSPFCKGSFNNNKILEKVAQTHNKSIHQIILKWLIQQDIIPVAKSKNHENLRRNIDIFDFKLTTDEMDEIFNLNKNLRCCIGEWADFKDPLNYKILDKSQLIN